jgi:hypothetical protein
MSGPAAIQTQTAAKPTITPVASGVLQRQCACGQHTSAGGECEECKQKREGTLQRAAISPSPVHDVPPIVHEVLRSPGQPLDTATRAFMETRFGHDFSGVQVHTDAKAAESARAVNALAYTVGQDVVFGARQYAPHSAVGRRLVAHELTHTLQQRHSAPPAADLSVDSGDSALESEADHAAEAVLTRSGAQVRAGVSANVQPKLQRQNAGVDLGVRFNTALSESNWQGAVRALAEMNDQDARAALGALSAEVRGRLRSVALSLDPSPGNRVATLIDAVEANAPRPAPAPARAPSVDIASLSAGQKLFRAWEAANIGRRRARS